MSVKQEYRKSKGTQIHNFKKIFCYDINIVDLCKLQK